MKVRGKSQRGKESETEDRLWIFDMTLLLCWYVSGCGTQDAYGQSVESAVDERQQDNITDKASEEDSREAKQVLVDFSAFTSTTLSNLVVLMTFGMMCPLLAVTLAVTIFTSALHLQFLVGSAIRQCSLGSYEHHKKIIRQLEKECDGDTFERSIYQVRFVLVSLSALFMSSFLFDMTPVSGIKILY